MKKLDKFSSLKDLDTNELMTINGGESPGYWVGYGLWMATFGWVQALDQALIELR